MKKSSRNWLIAYALVSVADVLLLALGNETIPRYLKPFLVPTLMAFVLCEYPPRSGRPLAWVLLLALL